MCVDFKQTSICPGLFSAKQSHWICLQLCSCWSQSKYIYNHKGDSTNLTCMGGLPGKKKAFAAQKEHQNYSLQMKIKAQIRSFWQNVFWTDNTNIELCGHKNSRLAEKMQFFQNRLHCIIAVKDSGGNVTRISYKNITTINVMLKR